MGGLLLITKRFLTAKYRLNPFKEKKDMIAVRAEVTDIIKVDRGFAVDWNGTTVEKKDTLKIKLLTATHGKNLVRAK
jgi:hypothetical protein